MTTRNFIIAMLVVDAVAAALALAGQLEAAIILFAVGSLLVVPLMTRR